jgi:uroporphyrinogen-III synthase
VRAATAMGLEVHGFPLFQLLPRAWAQPGADHFDALLVGSANAFRHGGRGLSLYRHLPVHVVGRATAQAAVAAGFALGKVGRGGLQPVLDGLAPGTRLLRLAGAERIKLTLPRGISMTEQVVYESRTLPMPPALVDLLAKPAVIALHSAEAARHLDAECGRLSLPRAHLYLAAMGARIGAAAGSGWAQVALAGTPDEAALLECAANLCQKRADTVRRKT